MTDVEKKRQLLKEQLKTLSDEQLQKVTDFVSVLKAQHNQEVCQDRTQKAPKHHS